MAGLDLKVIVTIPYKPRNWARKVHSSFARFMALVLHRRAGKTTAVVNHHLRAAINDEWERQRLLHLRPSLTPNQLHELIHPPGGRHYGHVMPTRVQAKVVAWDKLKFYASEVGGRPNESELLYRLPPSRCERCVGGRTGENKLQLFSADDPDALRGPAFSGLSFDEYSQQPRNIFSEVLSKATGDHLGYAMFLGTIKGKDHLYETYEAYKNDPECFALWQDIDKSLQTEEGITIQVLEQAMQDDRKMVLQHLMTQDEFDQEWYLSIEAATKGAFYGKELMELRQRGQICRIPYDPALPVDTDWDLGIDAMAIWFSQRTRAGEVRLIDYHEDIGGGLPECIKALKGQSGNVELDARRGRYIYGEHWGPHDIEVTEIGSGLTRRKTAAALGINFKVTPKWTIDDGINAVKLLLPRCFFEEVHTERGLECLRKYRKTPLITGRADRFYEFTSKPVHDWTSHAADAFRGLAVRYKMPRDKERERQELERRRLAQPSMVATEWS